MSPQVCLLVCLALLGRPQVAAPSQAGQDREAQFKQMAAQLASQRRSGATESQKPQDDALALLDSLALENLNRTGEPDLESLNRRLAALVTRQPPLGEGYTVIRLGGTPPVFALLANFGESGPSAVRIYAGAAQHYSLAARIDRFTQADFFDDYLELVPVDAAALVFVTVAGRTDELQTGNFTAWRFDTSQVRQLWTSDILQQSSYEARPDGFHLAYCADSDEDAPQNCKRMVQDVYGWSGGAWRRLSQTEMPKPS